MMAYQGKSTLLSMSYAELDESINALASRLQPIISNAAACMGERRETPSQLSQAILGICIPLSGEDWCFMAHHDFHKRWMSA